MKIFEKFGLTAILLIIGLGCIVFPFSKAHAAINSPSLGTADRFAILAGTPNITNVPTSSITGDVGLSPATGAGIGLTAAQVTGTIYAVDAAGPLGSIVNPGLLTTAKIDLATAYDNLIAGDNATCTVDYGAATKDLSLESPLGPGVYCVGAGGFEVNTTLALSGSGVWIFRSESTIVTAPGSSVTGGDPCNVWWRSETSTTLDTTTSFRGNILALASITMNTGATLAGRALARNGAVSLDSNTITNAACSAAATPTPSPAPSSGSSSTSTSTSGSGGTASCPTINCVPPLIIDSQRVDADSITFNWGPYAGTDTFTIQYGLENGKWLWSTNVTGFSTTLNSLPANQPIWVLISPRNSCSIAPCGVPRLIGGPKLPNTGFNPLISGFRSSW